jgi:hypothetical protein
MDLPMQTEAHSNTVRREEKDIGKRIIKTAWHDIEGGIGLFDKMDDCGYGNDDQACDELNWQFGTKEGWKSTGQSLKAQWEDHESDDTQSECFGHSLVFFAPFGKGRLQGGEAPAQAAGTEAVTARALSTLPKAHVSRPSLLGSTQVVGNGERPHGTSQRSIGGIRKVASGASMRLTKWHNTHWEYNPWTQWNSPWEHIYPGGSVP